MPNELINADFTQRVVIATDALPWMPSPQAGVERRLLDRIGGEVARATSLVRYAPSSAFPAHEHALGEEFFVLAACSPTSTATMARAPMSATRRAAAMRREPRRMHHPGQIAADEADRGQAGRDRHRKGDLEAGGPAGLLRLPLHLAPDTGESVTLERMPPGAHLTETD